MKSARFWLALACVAICLAGSSVSFVWAMPPALQPVPTPTPASTGEQIRWESFNGPYERTPFGLAIVPGGARSAWYAGTWGHGVYASQDGGETWLPRNAEGTYFEVGKYVRVLAAISTTNHILYAGTYGQGLYRSVDNGRQWEQLGTKSSFTELASPARNPLYVESLLIHSDIQYNWIGSAFFQTGDLKDPASLVTKLRDAPDPLSHYLQQQFSPYTRQLVDGYKTGAASEELKAALIVELNRLLYGRLYDEQRFAQVALSDQARQLIQQNPSGDDLAQLNRLLLAESYPRELSTRQTVFVGTHKGVWAASALEDEWTPLKNGFAVTDDAYNVQALTHNAVGWLYAGTLDGLYMSQDGGKKWERIGPPDGYPSPARRILSLAVVTDTTNTTGTVLVGTQGAGLYSLGISARIWITSSTSFPADRRAQTIQALLAAPNGIVYAGTVDFGVFASRDGGQTWQQWRDGLPSNSRSILSLALDPASGTLYAGTYGDGVYRLDQDKQQWEPANGRARNSALPVDFAVQKLGFAGQHSEYLLAGIQVGGLYSYTLRPSGSRWDRLPAALPIGRARDVVGLAVSGARREKVVVAAGTGIFSSTNLSRIQSWEHLTATHGLPAGDVSPVALAQGRDANTLYAVLAGGAYVYRSADGGTSWQSARGDLTLTQTLQITCLAVGPNDSTVFAGHKGGQLSITRNAGQVWNRLSPIEDALEVRELTWTDRSLWDVFWYAGPSRTLYARTEDGLYASYDVGQSWRPRMRGDFFALLADPHLPETVYAVSKGIVVGGKGQSDLWVSHDSGETWTRAGQLSFSVTTLAADPEQVNVLYAGTDNDGIYQIVVSPYVRQLSRGALAQVGLVVLLAAVTVYVWNLTRPYKLPPSQWVPFVYLKIRRKTWLDLAGEYYTRLTALERLSLALTPQEWFDARLAHQTLVANGATATLPQVESALNSLFRYGLLRYAEDKYELVSALLRQIARVRFWDDEQKRMELLEEIHRTSDLLAHARSFFQLAGFDVSSQGTGLRITPVRPEYALLGADKGIYVHLHTGPTVNADHIKQTKSNAGRAYEEKLAGRVAILIVSGPPDDEAYRELISLRKTESFYLVMLSYSGLRQATDVVAAQQIFKQSVRRTLGNQDLFQVATAPLDMLDFFGCERKLDELAEACRAERTIQVVGMTGVGKTSLVRQMLDRWPNVVVAWASSAPDLYADIRQKWSTDARDKFPQWEPPRFEPLAGQPVPEQIQADLIALRESLVSHDAGASLVVVLDELKDESASEEARMLERAVEQVDSISLIEILAAWPERADSGPVWPLRPFEATDSARLISSLALQMELMLDDAARDRLVRDSGGHPLILRQLASLAVGQAKGGVERITAEHVERATAQYVSRPSATLERLWNSLTKGERQVIRFVISTQSLPSGEVPERLAKLGWLMQTDGNWQLFSPVLARWLEALPSET